MSRTRTTLLAGSGMVVVGLLILVFWGATALLGLFLAGLTLLVGHDELRSAPAAPAAPAAAAAPAAGREVSGAPRVPPAAGPRELPLDGWSDAQLCRAWRVTYTQLQQDRGPVWAEHLAEQRRTYLDELERRDPTGVAAWLASGARAAGDPTRYLTATPRTP